jgi:hypothetical protein
MYFYGTSWRIYTMVTPHETMNLPRVTGHYLESRILSIRMDNDAEFSSCGFNYLHGLED